MFSSSTARQDAQSNKSPNPLTPQQQTSTHRTTTNSAMTYEKQHPQQKSNESPGKNGVTTNPVSQNSSMGCIAEVETLCVVARDLCRHSTQDIAIAPI
jgi:hypothetical protein